MHLSSIHRVLLAAILFAASWSTASLAATVSIVPSGSSSYTVQGADMDGVAGIELNLTHDQISTPTVTQGGLVSGAMLVSNTTRAGFIKIAIISTRSFTGSGPIATISFPSKSGSVGITSITSSMIDSKGSPIGVKTSTPTGDTTSTSGLISSAGVPFSQPTQTPPQTGTTATAATGSTTSTTTTTTSTATSTATPTYLGSVTLPQEQHADHQKPAPTSVVPPTNDEPAPVAVAEQPQTAPAETPAADVKPVETQQLVRYKGIIDRFKEYKGSKTLAAMTELFANKFAQLVRQEPAIVLSNGQNKAALTVDIPSSVNASPNFAVSGGTLISFNQDKQMSGRWTIDILPEAGAIRAYVTIITKSDEYEFPLAVTPPAKTELTLDESGWGKFIKETGTAGAPLHDLNNDGVRDYNDEYIFVANYLAAGKSPLLPARK